MSKVVADKATEGFTEATATEVALMKDDNGQALTVVYTKENIMINANSAFYSSVDVTTKKGKMLMYNAVTNTAENVADHINEVIELKDLIVSVIDVVKEETGEMEKAPRVILVDVNGVAYNSVSKGMHMAVKNIVTSFGEPSTWDEPLKVKVKQVKVARGSMLTLEIVE